MAGVANHAATFAPADLAAGIVLWVASLFAAGLILSPPANRHCDMRRTGATMPHSRRP
ncbi:MAG: hypothetical protein JOZ07_10420 [Solirubrobacterales bacterium]|nr:hypothetical protein [Solirubrobacterales bacterium]